MPQATFAYKVRDRTGRLVSGTLDAETQGAVASKLREMGYAPIAIDPVSTKGLKTEIKLPWSNHVSMKDLAVFSRQFATMIGSGLSLLRALSILADQTEKESLAKVARAVRSDVERGSDLSTALAMHPKVFNRLYISMARAGEIGGFLDQVLNKVADAFEKEVTLRGKIKSAMTYPVVSFALVLIIAAAMMIFVVPTFKSLYASLGGQLPLPTRILLAISAAVIHYSPLVILGVAAAVVAFRKWIATKSGRYRADVIKLKIKVFGPLFRKTALARFARTLSTLISSGVPILQALEIVSDAVNNMVVARALTDVQDAVRKGESLAAPLSKHAVFPPMVVQMIAVGEETGAVDSMLLKVAEFYDEEISAAVDSLTALIEPLLMMVMGAVVGTMVVALYLPMFDIIKLLG